MKRLLLAASALTIATPAAALTFNYTGSIVTWTATQDGTYEIVAVGAQGGASTFEDTYAGGLGALIGGFFELSSGTILQIAVGGMGASSMFNGGGGGGSFVIGAGNTPLIIAGGGGGIRFLAGQNGWNANTGPAGLSSSGSSPIGGGSPLTISIGQGGPAGGGYGSGGGGFDSNGGNDVLYGLAVGTGGASWLNGLAGGLDTNCGYGGNGGFGGGGAGAGCAGGGGGGGYSGGQGGFIAGGGGSFNADTLTGWAQAGIGTGNGSITINLMQSQEVSTPEPASATLALLGFFGLAAIRRRR